MPLSKKPYKGTRDLFPHLKRAQDHIFNRMHASARAFGFEHYDGPLIEEVELYKAKSGEELINDQIYAFEDRGKRFMAIRPEMTPTLARMVAQVVREKVKPIRWYSIPNLMRYERPQKGRLREHWQFNCDVFGSEGKYGELEILELACFLMESFGANAEHFEIRLNDRAFIDYVFKDLLKLQDDACYQLYKLVDRAKKIGEDKFKEELNAICSAPEQQDIFRAYLQIENFDGLAQFVEKQTSNDEQADSIKELFTFIELVKHSNINQYIAFDPYIVRGLDYYTGIVFEIFDKHPDNRRAICGGGTYKDLLKIFGEDTISATGFGLGDVTLLDFLSTHNLLPDFTNNEVHLFVSYLCEADPVKDISQIENLAKDLRSAGFRTIHHRPTVKLKKAFQLAEKNGASLVAFFGDQEKQDQTLTIKNLKTGKQESVSLTDHSKFIEHIRRECRQPNQEA